MSSIIIENLNSIDIEYFIRKAVDPVPEIKLNDIEFVIVEFHLTNKLKLSPNQSTFPFTLIQICLWDKNLREKYIGVFLEEGQDKYTLEIIREK